MDYSTIYVHTDCKPMILIKIFMRVHFVVLAFIVVFSFVFSQTTPVTICLLAW